MQYSYIFLAECVKRFIEYYYFITCLVYNIKNILKFYSGISKGINFEHNNQLSRK